MDVYVSLDIGMYAWDRSCALTHLWVIHAYPNDDADADDACSNGDYLQPSTALALV